MKSNRYRTKDGKAQIEWELNSTEKGWVFTASGACEGSCGQCIDLIAQQYPDDEMVQCIFKVWDKYHLNWMRAGCEHQTEMGWGPGKSIPFIVSDATPAQIEGLTKSILNGKVGRARLEFIKELKRDLTSGHTEAKRKMWEEIDGRKMTVLDSEFVTKALTGKVAVPVRYSGIPKKINDYINKSAEQTHPVVLEDRIYKDSIGAPCPVCGYCYGTEWRFRKIPDDVIDEINSWESNCNEDLCDAKAEEFLKKHDLKLNCVLTNNKKPEWDGPHGNHFRVSISRERGVPLEFDFWGSKNDKDKGVETLDAHSVLSCIAMDIHCPDKFEDFCSEYGYDTDSRKAEQMFNRADEFARELRAFFTSKEQEDLEGIR